MLFLFIFFNCLIILLIDLKPIYGSKIECNFKTYPSIGCSKDDHWICNNNTGFCECDPRFPINFDHKYCLPMKNMGEKCFITDQCLNSTNSKLFCYYLDSNPIYTNNSLIELNKSDAIQLFRLTNKRLEGFCRCDHRYDYDYKRNRCLHKNRTSINDPFGIDINTENIETTNAFLLDCSLDIECKTFDDYSHCDTTNKMCVCNEGFVKNVNNRCSKIKSLYQKCEYFDECIDRNSYCHKDQNICVCSTGYLPDLQNQICFRSRSLYEKCTYDRECSFQFGFCDKKRSVCVCDHRSLTLDVKNSLCVKRTNYGDICHKDFGDVVCQSSGDHLVCSKYTNRCVCEDGYVFRGDKCKPFNINRFGLEDEFVESETHKNPMTYIVIVFSSVFAFTIFASILTKMFRRRFTSSQLARYSRNNRQNRTNIDRNDGNGHPSAPPVYTESENSIRLTLRSSAQTVDSHNHMIDNEDKPPSYEEATNGYVIL